MVNMPLIQSIEDSLFSSMGGSSTGMILVALLIMVFFLIVLMIVGLDFRFALLIVSVLVPAFAEIGWFPEWVSGLFWVVVIGFALFLMWNMVRDR